ncbi:orotidine-5'-phosphate decarboxylase [Planctomycetota bacterium]
MKHFTDRVIELTKRKRSCLIVGLDPRLELIPHPLKKRIQNIHKISQQNASRIIYKFNKMVIDTIHTQIAGVKPQVAFYEKFGHWGIKAFWDTMAYAHKKGLLVIADVKRGDVPSTAQAYAEAYLTKDSPIDAITVNPLLGKDSLAPFINLAHVNGKGLFVLVKTSNPGSKDFQDLVLHNSKKYYAWVAQRINQWGNSLKGQKGYSLLGAVVGATFPQEASQLRRILTNNIFLVPGYGAQGAQAQDLKACFKNDKTGALINASRSITYAYRKLSNQPKNDLKFYAITIKQAVIKANREINQLIS